MYSLPAHTPQLASKRFVAAAAVGVIVTRVVNQVALADEGLLAGLKLELPCPCLVDARLSDPIVDWWTIR